MGNGAETAATPLASDVRAVLHSLAASLQTPLALLSRDDQAWRFEGEWLPPGFERDAELPLAPVLRHAPGDPTATDEGSGPLTGLVIGRARGREWVLLVPGAAD